MDQIRWSGVNESIDNITNRDERAAAIEEARITYYQCEACDARWSENDRIKALRLGKWISESQKIDKHGNVTGSRGRGKRVGLHYPAWLSPWIRMHKIAAAIVRAGKDPIKVQDVRNNLAAEPFEEQTDHPQKPTFARLASESSIPTGMVPRWAAMVLATADTQKDHWYYVIRAWGHEHRSQRIAHGRVQTLQELDRLCFGRLFPLVNDEKGTLPKQSLDCAALGIDTGGGVDSDVHGNLTELVYKYGRQRPDRVKLLKGHDYKGKGSHLRMGKHTYTPTKKGKKTGPSMDVYLWTLDANHFKDVLTSRISDVYTSVDRKTGEEVKSPLWDLDQKQDDDYDRQMASEHRIRTRNNSGHIVNKWVRVSTGADNHYWDCEVYQMVVANIMQVDQIPPVEDLESIRAQRDQNTSSRPNDSKRLTMPDGREYLEPTGETMQRFTSRKFIMAVAGVVISVALLIWPEQHEPITEAVNKAAGAVIIVLSTLGYIGSEALVDASRERNGNHHGSGSNNGQTKPEEGDTST